MSNWRLVNSSGGQVVKRSSSEQVLSSLPDRVIPITLEVVLDVSLLSLFSLQKGKLFLHEHFFFRESLDESLLQRAAADIQTHFSSFPDFEPLGLFIATWDDVKQHMSDGVGVSGIFIVTLNDVRQN